MDTSFSQEIRNDNEKAILNLGRAVTMGKCKIHDSPEYL